MVATRLRNEIGAWKRGGPARNQEGRADESGILRNLRLFGESAGNRKNLAVISIMSKRRTGSDPKGAQKACPNVLTERSLTIRSIRGSEQVTPVTVLCS